MPNMVRVNIRIPQELHDYYKKLSDLSGIPMSTLMLLDLQKQKEQSEKG